ncbi:hypothetical protein Calab_3698 [Caldithrix abyssi DSM 13497]|uniref:Xylose isomerase domain-containing protein TIM barrel n=1 Tax=Caldithrix abyssi DSM 13497 TaxID=880073 RepID=H1XNQ7_CALAY|nr:hypothetical protein [Caldithrix abyssi]APF19398.1 hypothetical protein Cabys_2650 [Caldithrix abyssi DSM 13497]EHO43295.1 hypothetical protein Calab_3698 [Caldithrix abyssi DSM 13497]
MLTFAKLGLASAVARPQNYSWQTTIEYARRAKFRQIQLFLNPLQLTDQSLALLQKSAAEFTLHLHLPTDFPQNDLPTFLNTFGQSLEREVYLIQHQPYRENVLQLSLNSDKIRIGIENDFPKQTPPEFLALILRLQNEDERILPVLDIPRFFHQAAASQTFEQTARQVGQLIFRLLAMERPFIIHALDHPAGKTTRQHWQPLLQGDLPWRLLIKMFIKRPELLKCLMFEYENWNMVKQSIGNLVRENFLKPIGQELR